MTTTTTTTTTTTNTEQNNNVTSMTIATIAILETDTNPTVRLSNQKKEPGLLHLVHYHQQTTSTIPTQSNVVRLIAPTISEMDPYLPHHLQATENVLTVMFFLTNYDTRYVMVVNWVSAGPA